MPYIIPGYTEYYEEGGILYISSKLIQNKIKITEPSSGRSFMKFYAVEAAPRCLPR